MGGGEAPSWVLPWTTVGHPGHPEVRFRFLPLWFATDLKVSEEARGEVGEGAGCPGASGGQE